MKSYIKFPFSIVLLSALKIIIPFVHSISLNNPQDPRILLGKSETPNSNVGTTISIQNFFKHSITTDKIEKISFHDAISDIPIIAYYFASPNCPACLKFTPYLRKLYEKWNKISLLIEIVWVPVGDITQQQWIEYFSQMPWLSFSHDDPQNFSLEQQFHLLRVPEVLIFSKSGELLTRDGYRNVIELGVNSIQKWLDLSRNS